MASFKNLQALGAEKFQKISNDITRNVSCIKIAQMIQQEWGNCLEIKEKTLTQQLNRLRLKMADSGSLGEEAKKTMKERGKLRVKLLRGSDVNTLEQLAALAKVQQTRISTLLDRELEIKMPMNGLSALINDYADLLVKMQKIRFDLGVDKFAGPVTGGFKWGASNTISPDGTTEQKQIIEAYSFVEDMFKKHGLYELPEGGS